MRKYPAAPHPFVLDLDLGSGALAVGSEYRLSFTLIGRGNQLLPYVIFALQQAAEQGIGAGRGRLTLTNVEQQDMQDDLRNLARPMLDLTRDQLALLRALLAWRVPQCEVRALCSRVTGRARPHSDLDLVIMTPRPLSDITRSELRADLEESDLPFRVDVAGWSELPDGLRAEINARSEIIREASVPLRKLPDKVPDTEFTASGTADGALTLEYP